MEQLWLWHSRRRVCEISRSWLVLASKPAVLCPWTIGWSLRFLADLGRLFSRITPCFPPRNRNSSAVLPLAGHCWSHMDYCGIGEHDGLPWKESWGIQYFAKVCYKWQMRLQVVCFERGAAFCVSATQGKKRYKWNAQTNNDENPRISRWGVCTLQPPAQK